MPAKKITLNPVALILLIAAILSALYFRETSNTPSPATGQPNAQTDTPREKSVASLSLSAQAKEYAGLKEPRLSDEEKASACRVSLESIETLPLPTLLFDLTQGRLKLDDQCLFLGRKKTPLLEGFPQACANLQPDQDSRACGEKLFFYKALRIQQATATDSLESLPNEVLVQKLIGLMADQSFGTAEGLILMREIGSKLYERLPSSESAAKAAAFGYIGDDNLAEADKVTRDNLMAELREKFPESWEIYEMDLLRRKGKDESDFRNQVQSFYRANQSSAIGQYYMGCLAWSEGRTTEAIEFFRASSASAPEDNRFSDTLTKAIASKPSEKVCSVQIGFNPDQF